MTKEYFLELADYNVWANNMVHTWLDRITDEQWEKPITSSFNSIAETVLHIAGTETVWLDRLNKVAAPVNVQATFKGSKKEVQELWKKSSEGLRSFIENFNEPKMNDALSFKRFNGQQLESPYYQIFAHAINHSTYHRGQVVTMLRQAGFMDVVSTDMVTFFWNKKK